ncbi:MAG TPA: DUF5916 domain-containing protein [Vicinamibacterales bacterium]|nr:DUF5916 domain-containing protein [Vicinamibacterales bacterium]
MSPWRALAIGFMSVVTAAMPASAQTPIDDAREPEPRALEEGEFEAVRLQKVVTAVRLTENESITLDGQFDEAAWSRAVPGSDFYQRLPRTGAPATDRTEVRVLYDDDTLYVGIMCFDPEPERIVIKELKEDFDINGTDMVQLIIDSLHDRRSAFALSVNAAGARRDTQVSETGASNNDWDGVWDVKTGRTPEGWTLEYAVPFKTLRFSNEAVQEWGLQIARRVPRRNEESEWAPVPFRYTSLRTQFAGTLRGLENVSPGRNLKVKPYVLGQSTETLVAGSLQSVRSLSRFKDYNGGFDLKYSVTRSLTLDTTYRTDFAQVEVDQQQTNLTRFNVFFPEKRDFFLENSGIFNFGPGGNLVPFFSRRIGLSPAGAVVPIIGGGRVSGQLREYNVGFLAMKTEDAGPTPSNNYVVGRVRRNLLRNSWVGALGTSRDSTLDGNFNRVYGADAHFQFWDRLEFDSYLLRSDTPARPGNNLARRFQTGWRDDELTASVEYNEVQPNFNPEVGFVRRGEMSQYNGEFGWAPLIDHPTIQNLNFGTTVDYYRSEITDNIETRVQEATTGLRLRNNGSANFVVTRTFERLVEPFDIHSDVTIPVGDYDYQNYTANFNAGSNRRTTGSGSITWGEFWDGESTSFTGTLGLRPNYHWSLDLNYTRNDVSLVDGDFTTNLIGARFLYAFTPRAIFNSFLQYNTDTRQVSSNIRFNWTHHPLSDIYIVYNHAQDTGRGQTVGRTFIVKVTNLFNF